LLSTILAFTPRSKAEKARSEREKGEEIVPRHHCFVPVDIMTTVIQTLEPWSRSVVTREMLERPVADGLLWPITDRVMPEWRVLEPDAKEPHPPTGYVVSFVAFHEQGLRVPASKFMRSLPYYYGVELHNFAPNSIAQAVIFAALCEGYLGIPPY
jgi:hypothetical protein